MYAYTYIYIYIHTYICIKDHNTYFERKNTSMTKKQEVPIKDRTHFDSSLAISNQL